MFDLLQEEGKLQTLSPHVCVTLRVHVNATQGRAGSASLSLYFLLTRSSKTYSVLRPKPQTSSVREELGQMEGKNAGPHSVRQFLYQCKPE